MLATLSWIIGGAIITAIVVRIAGVRRLSGLDDASRLLTLLGLIAMQAVACWLAARVVGRDPRQLLGVMRRIRWRLFWRLAGIAALFKLLQVAIHVALALLSGDWSELAHTFAWPGIASFVPLAAMLLVLVPTQILGEELFYRGTVQQTIGAWTRYTWIPVVVSAVAFTASHAGTPAAMTSLGVFGLVTAWLTIRTAGLEAALALHWVNNTVGMLLMAASGDISTENINNDVTWLSAAIDIAVQLAFVPIALGLAQRALAVADQLEQNAPERSLGV